MVTCATCGGVVAHALIGAWCCRCGKRCDEMIERACNKVRRTVMSRRFDTLRSDDTSDDANRGRSDDTNRPGDTNPDDDTNRGVWAQPW